MCKSRRNAIRNSRGEGGQKSPIIPAHLFEYFLITVLVRYVNNKKFPIFNRAQINQLINSPNNVFSILVVNN